MGKEAPFDYTTRTAELDRLMQKAGKEDASVLVRLANVFYAVSYPIEFNEHVKRPDVRKIRQDIKEYLADDDNQHRLNWALESGGVSQEKKPVVIAAGLRGVFQVVGERFKDGTLSGNGHHAMQEASANAVIRIAEALKINI
jgi:hypothetical protein